MRKEPLRPLDTADAYFGSGYIVKPSKLRVPRQKRYPDSFYENVAATYRYSNSIGEAPTPHIAKVAKVPITTAARWVKKAQRHKILGPGKRGRAGEAQTVPLEEAISEKRTNPRGKKE